MDAKSRYGLFDSREPRLAGLIEHLNPLRRSQPVGEVVGHRSRVEKQRYAGLVMLPRQRNLLPHVARCQRGCRGHQDERSAALNRVGNTPAPIRSPGDIVLIEPALDARTAQRFHHTQHPLAVSAGVGDEYIGSITVERRMHAGLDVVAQLRQSA
ncbi:MAG TPA: hypothetical protein VMM78_17700 [Thermomicrobiales bacterium]|nr:hypothetical protein [Thermomicrobiales bacterium]